MKNKFLSLLAVTLLGSVVAHALDATAIEVSLPKINSLKAETLPTPGDFPWPKAAAETTKSSIPWQVVNVPLEIRAKAKDSKTGPDFVPALNIHAYLVVQNETLGEPVILDKEISYVDIPLVSKASGESKGTMLVGLFISPSNAKKLNEKGNGTLKVLAVAVEAQFKDVNCMGGGDPYAVFQTNLKSKLNGKGWWKKKSKTGGVTLHSVSETPFAPFIRNYYPATEPRFGAAETPQKTSSAPTIPGTGDYTPAPPTSLSDDTPQDGSVTDGGSSTETERKPRDKRTRHNR